MSEDRDVIAAATRAVRKADRDFQLVGGSSRHWIRECFLPELERHGLRLLSTAEPTFTLAEVEAAFDQVAESFDDGRDGYGYAQTVSAARWGPLKDALTRSSEKKGAGT